MRNIMFISYLPEDIQWAIRFELKYTDRIYLFCNKKGEYRVVVNPLERMDGYQLIGQVKNTSVYTAEQIQEQIQWDKEYAEAERRREHEEAERRRWHLCEEDLEKYWHSPESFTVSQKSRDEAERLYPRREK